jgi:hypothetical protein
MWSYTTSSPYAFVWWIEETLQYFTFTKYYYKFDPGLVHVGFVVDKVVVGQIFLRVLRFSPVNFIPPVLH